MCTKTPLISIIVPVYNASDYLDKCIESILAQTYNNIQIIIINDGSTDTSDLIIEQYANKDKRVRAINTDNNGVAAARNIGIDMAEGVLIGFVDADDWIEADMYDSLYTDMLFYNADVSSCGHNKITMCGERLVNFSECVGNISLYSDKQSIMKYSIHTYPYLWCKLFKKHLFEGLRFPEDKAFEDLHLIYQLLERADIISCNPAKKYNYLQRPSSLSQNVSTPAAFDVFDARVGMCAFISTSYPTLLPLALPKLYMALIWIAERTCETKSTYEIYQHKLDEAIETVRTYPYISCGISQNDELLLKLLLSNMKHIAITAFLQKKVSCSNDIT